MGAYLLLFPGARVLTAVPVFYFLTFVTLPAWVFLLVWFAIQLVQGLAVLQGGEGVTNIAWWAHAGGFAAGMAMRFVFAKRKQQQRF
jgi:membrane associated rhomboid family serine protease